jgi:hypothetical protein
MSDEPKSLVIPNHDFIGVRDLFSTVARKNRSLASLGMTKIARFPIV